MMRTKHFFPVFAMLALLLTSVGSFAQSGSGPAGPATSYDTRFSSWHFSGSGNCAPCHNDLRDSSGQDRSIETAWSSTLMAHATRDPLWQAKVRSELMRNSHLAEAINKKCSRCHAPMASVEADFHGDYIHIFGSAGFLDPNSLYFAASMDAVSCTLCHQIIDSPALGSDAGFSGHFEITTYTNPQDRLIYGPNGELFVPPMRNQLPYGLVASAHTKESKLCATCHNLKTPYVDENGNLLTDDDPTTNDEFPEQMVYSEWEHSSYVSQQSCQGCHLPRANGVPDSSRPIWLPLRNDFATHDMVGGNLLLLDILDNNRAELGVFSKNFATTIIENEKLLQQAASIKLLESQLADGILDFTLQINSNTGHKLPTSIPLHRLILHVTIFDRQGNVVFESGQINPNGSISGVDADQQLNSYEPHYDLITDESQVQVYEAVMQDNLQDVTYTLLRAMAFSKDNRLLPKGFDKASAGSDIQVVGGACNDSNFQGGSDMISYHIESLPDTYYRVTAELVFQPVSYASVQDLIQDSAPEINAFKVMFANSNRKSSQVGSALEFTLEF